MAESNEIPLERTPLSAVVTLFLMASVPLAIVGAVLAGVTSQDTYRCTTQFMVKPAPLANRDKEVLLPLMPSSNDFKSILTSDRVTQMVFTNHRLRQIGQDFFSDITIDVDKYLDNERLIEKIGNGKADKPWEWLSDEERLSLFRTFVEDSVWLEQVTVEDERQTLVILMHVEHRDSEICQSISKWILDSLRNYFEEEKKSAIGRRVRTVSVSIEKLHPMQLELTNRYRTFKRDAPLLWTSDGRAINPYDQEMERVRDRLTQQKDELVYRRLELSVLKAVSSSKADRSDTSPEQDGDLVSKTEPEETPNDEKTPDRKPDDMEAKVVAIEAIVQWKEKRITELQEQLKSTKSKASKLRQYESEEKSQRRQIERIAPLLEQLEVEMLKLSLLDAAADIQVIELNAPSLGYLVYANRRMWFGAGLGVGLGLLLASLTVHSMSVDSKRRRLAESPA